jgi:4-diphosphocytidyl-2-C-methyl-D-erythritol kinase
MSGVDGQSGRIAGPGPVELTAPAKLTVSLRVTGVRADGYHLLEAEMVTLDLVDTLVVSEGDGLSIDERLTGPAGASGSEPWRSGRIDPGPDNLVNRALREAGRTAHVDLVKRIPPGAGLGGGSADAAAILRWAGIVDPVRAAVLGADIPFCVLGGRALVRGIGEDVTPVPFEPRAFTLFLLPFGMDTRAVYASWDLLHEQEQQIGSGESGGSEGPGESREVGPAGANDLEAPAVALEPRLGTWRDHLAELTGHRPGLAGSGSTWFVEGTPTDLGLEGRSDVHFGAERARIVGVRTVPAS